MSNVQTQLSISLFVLVVFLTGLGAGILGTNWVNSGPPIGRRFGPGGPTGPSHQRSQGGPPFINERLMDRLASSIDLTNDQADRLEALFESRREGFREMTRMTRERFNRDRDEFHTAVSEILTVEQMQRFESEFVRMGNPRRRGFVRPGERPSGAHPPTL
jgi:Spy/CpxP family protein refolding chaperone